MGEAASRSRRKLDRLDLGDDLVSAPVVLRSDKFS
jgi:hypothetical protein